MQIMLMKAALIGKHSHAQGDVIDCDEQRAKYLIRHGIALEVSRVTTAAPPDEDEVPEEAEKRKAVLKPKTRKAVLDV